MSNNLGVPKSVAVNFLSGSCPAKTYHYLVPIYTLSQPEVGDYIITNTRFGSCFVEDYATRIQTFGQKRSFGRGFSVAIITEVNYGKPHPWAIKEYVGIMSHKWLALREESIVYACEKREAQAEAQAKLDIKLAEFAARNSLEALLASDPEARRLHILANN
jgi:hypothetical protein